MIRVNYTADSNAMLVILTTLFADAEEFLGNATGAAFYRTRAAAVKAAMNAHLLAATNDHYCTQVRGGCPLSPARGVTPAGVHTPPLPHTHPAE